jgi:hypothetical protein
MLLRAVAGAGVFHPDGAVTLLEIALSESFGTGQQPYGTQIDSLN